MFCVYFSNYERLCFIQSEMNEEDVHDLGDDSHLTPGVVYLSSIPIYYRLNKIRESFGQFGKLGRLYLSPGPSIDGKRCKIFTEVSFYS